MSLEKIKKMWREDFGKTKKYKSEIFNLASLMRGTLFIHK